MERLFTHNFRIVCCLLFVYCSIGSIHTAQSQQTRARYNLAGYAPSGNKRIVVISDVNYQGQSWTVKNQSNSTVLSGTVGASVTGAGVHTPKAFNHIVDISGVTDLGSYTVSIGSITPFTIEVKNAPYKIMTHEVLSALRARRSGSNDAVVHGFSHGEDATAPVYNHDGSSSFRIENWSANGQTVDMLGGWYDAGDYIKFTQTVAYAAYNLALAYVVSPETFDGVKNYSQTGYDDMLDEIKFGMDYLMKTMPNSNTFIIQVADEQDHNVGNRMPENDTNTPRPALNIKSRYQLAHTAAALALGHTVFKDINPSLANSYLSKAQTLYAEAKATNIATGYLEANTNPFYKDDLPGDQMCLAATELYIATGQSNYLTEAEGYIATDNWSSWANVTMKANFRLAPYSSQAAQAFDQELGSFKNTAQAAANIWNVPHNYVWGSLYSQFGVGASAFSYKILNPADEKYDDMAMGVLDYTFGINNWGVGFVASQSYPGAISTSYAQIFKLQPQIFPTGEIAEGPAPEADHLPMRQYWNFDINLPISGTSDRFQDFNTSSIVYFEYQDDFVCSETTIAGLADGVLLLAMASSVLDDGGTGNLAPVAVAGNDQTLSEGSTSSTLNGSNSNDPDNGPSPLTYNWSQISGPAANIASANSANTSVSGLSDGNTYSFRLTVNDGEASSSDQVSITVNSSVPNQAPDANAGQNQTLAAGTSSTSLNGNGSSDPDNGPSPLSYSWTQISGPSATLTNAGSANATVNGLSDGNTYIFRLTVDDGEDNDSDEVVISVNSPSGGVNLALNRPAVASSVEAGSNNRQADKAVDGDGNSRWASLYATDPSWIYVDLGAAYDIDEVRVYWEAAYATDYQVQVSQDASNWTVVQNVSGNSSLDNIWTGLTANGRYVRIYGTQRALQWGYSIYELEVYGEAGDPVNQAPIADAGSNQSLNAGTTLASLNASGSSDPDNGPSGLSYSWTQVSGPSATLNNANSVDAIAVNLSDGNTYVFRVTVSDGDLSDSDNVQVIVNSAANQVPIADAGSNQTLAAGITSTSLDGAGSYDPDNGPSSLTFNWSQLSGVSVNISGANTVNPTVSGLSDGNSYSFMLVVNDGSDDSAASIVDITVNQSSGGSCLMSSFNVPRATPISNNFDGAGSTYVLGSNAAAQSLRNHGLSSTSISFNPGAQALYYFGIGGNGRSIPYWTNLTPSISHTLGSNEPTMTFSSSNIQGLDGTYYVNEYSGGGWVLVHDSGEHALVLTNGSAPSDCTNPGARFADHTVTDMQEQSLVGGLSIYPNPTRDQITFDTGLSIHQVRVLDLNGSIVKTIHGQSISRVSLSSLYSGVYFVQLVTDRGVLMRKVIKQ